MKRSVFRDKSLCALLFALSAAAGLHLIFMAVSGKWLFDANPYDSYAKQAAAWAQGRLDLGQDYSWLELAIFRGRYYVSFPPFPSYVLLPFALFLGEDTPDHLIAFLSMLCGVVFAWRLARQLELDVKVQALLPVFLFCAGGLWQITVDGWVWFLAQSLSFTLTLASFSFAMDGRKGRAFFCLCAAVGCRPFQILYIPLLCLLLLRRGKLSAKELLWDRNYRLLPAALLACSFMALNVMRFGDPFEFGHSYLPEFVNSEHGQFSLAYLGENLQSLVRLPEFDTETFTLRFPMFNGSSIFLIYPLLWLWIGAVFEKLMRVRRTPDAKPADLLPEAAILLTACLHLLLLCSHKTMGGSHFGNRYPADVMPLFYLSLLLMKSEEPAFSGRPLPLRIFRTAAFALLFAFGFTVNFFGALSFYAA